MTNEHEPDHKFTITPVEQTDESISLQVSRGNEAVVFTWKPAEREVLVKFGAGEQVATPEQQEHPEITLEGRVAKQGGEFGGAKYDREKHTFSMRIAHQYNPENKQDAHYYNVVAEGEAADTAYSLYLNSKGVAVRVGGWDMSGTTKLDKGTKGLIKADFIEKLPPGCKPGYDMLPGRVRLADNESRGER